MSEDKKISIVEEARERFERVKRMNRKSRLQAIADTKFYLGDSDNGWQWDEQIAMSRRNAKKVCLTVNLTAQHCNQIVNNIRQNRPACRVLPVDDYSDKKTAEILAGLIRNIQTSSASDDAHDLAAEHAIVGGEGYWRIITEYESPRSTDQVIRIKSCPNPQLVYIDPDCKELDKSDAMYGFVFEEVNKETFERENPNIDASSWTTDSHGWVSEETIRIAEYFYCEFVEDTAYLLSNGANCLKSELPDDVTQNGNTLTKNGQTIEIIKERKTFIKKWKWCKLVGGSEEPVNLKDWAGQYLPIISVTGKELNVDGELVRKGIVRDLKDPARMVNYSYSETVHTLALQNKIPYLAASDAISGYEDIWGAANLENAAYLPFNAYDKEGNPLPRPERQQPAVMPAAQVQLLQLSTEEMRGASGQQNSNFGIKSEASSGIGIQRLKQQGEIATFHFPDNLARGLRYEAKVLIDLIQVVYDTRRVVRVLGIDGQQDQAMLDPDHPQSYSEVPTPQDIQKIFNPSIGQYDVVIDTGPSFQTQRQEGAAALNELASRNPALMQVAGDLIMRAQDFPMAEQLADRLQKTLPPNLQDAEGGAEQQVAQLSAQMHQAQQQMMMMQQALQEAQQKLQVAESGQAKSQMEIQAKMQMAQMEAQLQDAKLQRDIEAKKQAFESDAEMKREQAVLQAHLDKEKFDQEHKFLREKALLDAHLMLEKAKMDNETKEEIAELTAYVEMQKAGKDNPALTADVNADLGDDAKPKKKSRKKVTMVAPSGASYSGTIEDDLGE